MKKKPFPAPDGDSCAPYASPARRASGPADSGPLAAEHTPRAASLLLVDDDATVRDSLGEVLASEGYTVVPAENGQQAVEIANRSPVDLVVLDLNMPVKPGWDTFEQLTREHPLVPVIIATARANQVVLAAAAGAGALLEKPMDIPVLLRTVRELLDEPPEQRLARLAGEVAKFHYQPSASRAPAGGVDHRRRSLER